MKQTHVSKAKNRNRFQKLYNIIYPYAIFWYVNAKYSNYSSSINFCKVSARKYGCTVNINLVTILVAAQSEIYTIAFIRAKAIG